MKPHKPIVKILTIASFFVLITGFVAYRSGAFTGAEHVNPIEKERSLVDSPPPNMRVDSFVPIMSGTKSGKVIEPKKNNTDNSNSLKSTGIMSSSKSGIIVDDELTKDLNGKNDSATVAKQDSLLKEALLKELIMGSSKSGAIFVPKQDTGKKKPKK